MKLLKEAILRQIPTTGSSPEEPILWKYEDSGQRIVARVKPEDVKHVTSSDISGISRVTLVSGTPRQIFVVGEPEAVKEQLGICTVQEEASK